MLALCLCLLALTSCENIFGSVEDSGKVTVVVEEADGSFSKFDLDLSLLENKSEGGKGVLEHLSQQKDGLYLEMVDSSYGAYVVAIGNIKENLSEGLYVMCYTSAKADSYEGAPTIQYSDRTLYMSGVGLSFMTVEAGGVILFRLEKSPY